jgi:tRNA(Ser,Leu) C12 N-acetylase TAN1
MPWNILATSQRFSEGRLLNQLKPFGRFHKTGYRDVVVGWVENTREFLKELEEEYERFPFNLSALSKVVAVEATFEFTVETFEEKLKEAIKPFIEQVDNHSFHTRMERRGLKGELDSFKLEQSIGRYIHEELSKLGKHPVTDFKDPDMVVAIETIGNEAGVALVTREMKEKSRFVRVK